MNCSVSSTATATRSTNSSPSMRRPPALAYPQQTPLRPHPSDPPPPPPPPKPLLPSTRRRRPHRLCFFPLSQHPQPLCLPHNLLMRAHTLLSSPLPALLVFSRMRCAAVIPDSHAFTFALQACANFRSPALGRAFHCQALKFGFAADYYVRNTLISAYAPFHSMLEAQGLFDECPSSRHVVTYNTLMDGYVKVADIAFARKLFDEMPARDATSWGTLLAGYSKVARFEEAIELFDGMLAKGTAPDDVALVSALSCCAQLGKLDRGEAIHEYIKKNRAELTVYLSTGLVDMYANCGCISVATEIFESTPWKNLFTWNAIIVGLAVHGNGEMSLEYFNRMRAVGVRPDGLTFLGVLVACSRAGLVDMARSLFDEMESVYGVERELKHYGCMADLLGRDANEGRCLRVGRCACGLPNP